MAKITTQSEVRLSYVNLITPRPNIGDDGEKKGESYSTAILIPKSDTETVEAIKKAINDGLQEGIEKKWGGKRPSGRLHNPLRDGDEDRADDPSYAGHWFLNAKGPRGGAEPAILLDSKGRETTDASVIYSGVYARVTLQFYPFDRQGNRGVAAGVVSVLSSERGEPLAAVVTAESARSEFGITTSADDAKADFASDSKSVPQADAPVQGFDAKAEDPWGA